MHNKIVRSVRASACLDSWSNEMKVIPLRSGNFSYLRISALALLGLVALLAGGCGGTSNGAPPRPPPPGNTSVTLLLSSTANDQLSQFNINLTSLSLTSQTG